MLRLWCVTILVCLTALLAHSQSQQVYVGATAGFAFPFLNEQHPSRERINLDDGVHTATFSRERSNLGSGLLMNVHVGIKVYKQLFFELGFGSNIPQSQQFFSVLEEQSDGGRIVNNEYRRIIETQHTFRYLYLAPVFITSLSDKMSMHMRGGILLAHATMQSQIQMSVQDRNSGFVQTSSANIRYNGSALPGMMMQIGAGYRLNSRVQINADFALHALSYRVEQVEINNRMFSGIAQPDLIFDYTGSTRHYSATSSGYSPAASQRYMFSGAGIQLGIQYLFHKR